MVPGSNSEGVRNWDRGGKEANTGCSHELVTSVNNKDLIAPGTLWETMLNLFWIVPRKGREAGIYLPASTSLAQDYSWGINSQASLAYSVFRLSTLSWPENKQHEGKQCKNLFVINQPTNNPILYQVLCKIKKNSRILRVADMFDGQPSLQLSPPSFALMMSSRLI